VEGDTVYDLDIVTNRPDCMNARGLARELSAVTGAPLTDLAPLLEVTESGGAAADRIDIQVHVPELCHRFMTRVVTGVRVGPSPEWLASRLRRVGLRPLNNLVDITNYVMLELGHPMHAFDLRTLRGNQLHVRRATAGERLITLDGTERKLEDWMILIADGERPASLAGVMGGAETEISDATTDVLLEAAWWDPVTIYRTGRALGLSSDASYRFERGTDVNGCGPALDRAARLVAELAGGEVSTGIIDIHPTPYVERDVPLRLHRLRLLLGLNVEAGEAVDTLRKLGFQPEEKDEPGNWDVRVPSYRRDVAREEDLIEEIGRVLGYDRVPETLPRFESREHGRLEGSGARQRVERLLEAAGFHQAINFSFASRDKDARFSPWPDDVLALANPMSVSGDVMRSSLLPHLVENVQHNVHFGTERVRLYEVGRVFQAAPGAELPHEHLHLGLVATGPARLPHWSDGTGTAVDIFDLTGPLEQVLAHLRLPRPEARALHAPFLAPGSGVAWVLDGREVARFGRLAGPAAEDLDLDAPVYVAEAALDTLMAAEVKPLRINPLPRYPSMVRDLSLVLPRTCTYSQVEAAIRAVDREMIVDVAPFDRYAGKGLPSGTVGLSVSIRFQHVERTLVSDEVDALQARIVAVLDKKLGARLRSGD
jgi:phenylalanyl-tRNA synthetase beta chain